MARFADGTPYAVHVAMSRSRDIFSACQLSREWPIDASAAEIPATLHDVLLRAESLLCLLFHMLIFGSAMMNRLAYQASY